MGIVRTTVSISDELLLEAKRRARERGLRLGEVIDAALRREFAIPKRGVEHPTIPVFHGTGPQPGVDLTSNRALQELSDDGVDLDKRR